MRFASVALGLRDSSRPKACTERITLPRRFNGAPHPWFAGAANLTAICVRCHKSTFGYRPPLCYLAVTRESARYYPGVTFRPAMATNPCNPASLPTVTRRRGHWFRAKWPFGSPNCSPRLKSLRGVVRCPCRQTDRKGPISRVRI
jgi:hypothetical protein